MSFLLYTTTISEHQLSFPFSSSQARLDWSFRNNHLNIITIHSWRGATSKTRDAMIYMFTTDMSVNILESRLRWFKWQTYRLDKSYQETMYGLRWRLLSRFLTQQILVINLNSKIKERNNDSNCCFMWQRQNERRRPTHTKNKDNVRLVKTVEMCPLDLGA